MAQGMAKYMVLVHWIKEQIFSHNLQYGQKFYSENELSEMFGMSRQTVRHAVGILEQEGLVQRRRGSGTYVVYGGEARQDRTNSIGVISTYMDSYIFPSIIKGIDQVLSRKGYTMQLSLTNNKVENESRSLRLMIDNNVDGLIVEPTKSGLYNPNVGLYNRIRELGKPLIFFNAYYPGMEFPHICMDDKMAGHMAVKCLIDAGHRDIAGIFQSDDRQGHLRYAGFVDALLEAGMQVPSSHVLWFTTEDIPYIATDFQRVERSIDNCTAVVCYNDQIAYSVVTELRKRGVSVPDDISVTGIDNAEIASICEVPLTTMAHPMSRLGEVAAENILGLIENPGFDANKIFPPKLITRTSVKTIGR